jgi:tetratricopeptide (TPR) repeat protein
MYTVINAGQLKRAATGFLSLLIMGLFTGCATQIHLNMLLPADYHEASLTKTVAVLPFGGPDGAAAAAEFEAVLGGINIDDKRYFTVVDRLSIDKTISELKLGQSGLVDAGTAARIGDLVGAQGIYTGIVTQSAWNDSHYRETRQECTQREVKRDDKGRTYEGNCIRWRSRPVSCIKRVAGFACSPKLIEVRTSRVLYAQNLSGSADASGCEDENPLPGGQELLRKAKEIAKAEFRKDVAPHYVTRQVSLMDDTAGMTSGDAKDKLKRGIEYAAKGRMDQACELWGESRILSPSTPSILYDLGICAESRGDFDAALKLYREADKQLGKPDDRITLALNRMTEAIRNRTKLQQQLKSL